MPLPLSDVRRIIRESFRTRFHHMGGVWRCQGVLPRSVCTKKVDSAAPVCYTVEAHLAADGEMSERSMVTVLKTVDVMSIRGFESHSLRQRFQENKLIYGHGEVLKWPKRRPC